MPVNRYFLGLLFAAESLTAAARHVPRPLTTTQAEARNEVAAPGFSAQAREARRVAEFLTDALRLSYAQQYAVRACTLAQHQALALAVTAADLARIQHEYRVAMQRILAVSQLSAYTALCQRHRHTLLPLDSVALAAR